MIFKHNPLSPIPNAFGFVTGKVEWESIASPAPANLLFMTLQADHNDERILCTFYLNAETGDVYRLTHPAIYGSYEGSWHRVRRA